VGRFAEKWERTVETIKRAKTTGAHRSKIVAAVLFSSIVYLFFMLWTLPAFAAEPQTAVPTPQTAISNPNVLETLGSRYAVALLVVMIVLMGFVFYLFVDLGRRIQARGYLGPLAIDAIARAEIARREDKLREDLRSGKIAAELEPASAVFKERYQIPSEEKPPPYLTPGLTIDEGGRILGYGDGWGSRTGGALDGSGWSANTLPGLSPLWPDNIQDWTAERLVSERNLIQPDSNDDTNAMDVKSRKLFSIRREIESRFVRGYQREQLNEFYKERTKLTDDERKRAVDLLPSMDVSSFGGGWVFVLEFTTIIFIVFAVLALGLLGVLKSEPIATILAAVAGYVLGKSTSIRGPGGEEIRRGGEESKALFEAMTKQEEIRSLRDEDKIKLQREVEDLKRQFAESKVTVPGVTGFATNEAESKLKEKNLMPDTKEVENSGAETGKVFHQQPEANAEVAKGSTVVLFVAKKTSPSAPTKVPNHAPSRTSSTQS
jgi:PASTA domain